MASSQKEVLRLYKLLLRESSKFPSYNFRHYALRKVRDSFKANKQLADANQISNKLAEANKNLDVIKRQVVIGQMYATDKLVIENINQKRANA